MTCDQGRKRVKARGRGLTATLLVSALIAVGCSGKSGGGSSATDVARSDAGTATTTASSPGSVPAGDSAAKLDPDASLKMMIPGPTASLDPHTAPVPSVITWASAIYDPLTKIAADGTVEPNLVSHWEYAPDGSTLTLTLRDDVTFHDGSPLDAEAVRANLQRALTVDGSVVAKDLGAIASMAVTGPYELTITLVPGRGVELPAVLAMQAGFVMNPKYFDDSSVDLALKPPADAGSGVYELTDFAPNVKATYERAPGPQWDPDARGAAKLEIEFAQDPVARLNAIRTHAADIVVISGGQQIAEAASYADAGEFGYYVTPTRSAFALYMRADSPAFSDVRVREAVARSIDKDAVAENLMSGYCPATNSEVPSSHWAYDASVENLYSYDPDRARALIGEAGATGEKVELTTLSPSPLGPVAEAVVGQLQAVGLDVSLTPTDAASDVAPWVGGKGDGFVYVTGSFVDPSQLIAFAYTDRVQAVPQAERDAVRARAAAALDPKLSQDERAKLYQALLADLHKDFYMVPICTNEQGWAHAANVVGTDTQPMSPFGFALVGQFGVEAK